MFGQRRRTPDVTACVEISSRAVRVVRLRAGTPMPEVEVSERRALPAEGEPARPSALAEHLRELAPLIGSGNAEVRLVVDAPSLVLRSLLLPRMPDSEVLSSVRLQWPQLCPTPFQEMQVDIFCTRSQNPRSPGLSVLVAALPREELAALLSPLREAGLEIGALIPGAVALRMLRREEAERRETESSVEAILDIGLGRSCLVLARGEEVLAARDIPTAGQSFTQILSRELDVPVAEAEKLKRQHGIAEAPDPEAGGEDASTLRSIHGALRPVVERLSAEVQRSIAFVQEERAEQRPAKLLLTGGGAKLPGLAERMAELLDIAVEVWEPGQRLPVAAGQEQAGAMCLGGATGRPLINLLEPSRAASGPRRPRAGLALYAGAYVVLLAGVVGWFWNAELRISRQVAAQDRRLAMIPAGERAALAFGPYLLARGREQADFKRIFEELYWLVPEEVSLETMTLERPATLPGAAPRVPRVLQIEGAVNGPVIASEQTLAQLLEAVEDSPIIRNVQLVRSAAVKNPEERGLRFAFKCEVDESGMAGAIPAAAAARPEGMP